MLDYALRIFTENSKKTEHYLHDTWFSDNITLIQNFRENAEVLLISIEIATKIVLHVNEIETDCIVLNQGVSYIKTLDSKNLKCADGFLGLWL